MHLLSLIDPLKTVPASVTCDSGYSLHYGCGAAGLQRYGRFGSATDAGIATGRPVSSTSTMGGASRTLAYQYDSGARRSRLTLPGTGALLQLRVRFRRQAHPHPPERHDRHRGLRLRSGCASEHEDAGRRGESYAYTGAHSARATLPRPCENLPSSHGCRARRIGEPSQANSFVERQTARRPRLQGEVRGGDRIRVGKD